MSKYIPYILLLIVAYIVNDIYNAKDIEIAMLEQNNSALDDTLTLYATDNIDLYSKLAYIEGIHDSTLYINDSLDQKIQIMTRQLIALEEIKISGEGTIILDTTIVMENCKGIVITFSDENGFYKYTDTIIVNDPPSHNLRLSFKPFPITSYLTIDEEGKIRTILELKGVAKNFIKISSVETTISPEFYKKYMGISNRLDFFLMGGISTNPEIYLHVGAGIIKGRDMGFYNYGSNSSHQIMYGRIFNLW